MSSLTVSPALICGAFAERMKFSAMLWFSGLWLCLVYLPICHWIWGNGWLAQMGAKDFAGGIVGFRTRHFCAMIAGSSTPNALFFCGWLMTG